LILFSEFGFDQQMKSCNYLTRLREEVSNALWNCNNKTSRLVLYGFWIGAFASQSPTLLRSASPSVLRRVFKAALATFALSAMNIRRGGGVEIPEIVRVFLVPLATCGVLLANLSSRLNARQRQTLTQRSVLYGSIPYYAAALESLSGHSEDKNTDELDVLALISMLLGVLRGQDVAALIILLMVTSGEALEQAIEGKAKRSLDQLLESIPRIE
jgi:cation transport ATPase